MDSCAASLANDTMTIGTQTEYFNDGHRIEDHFADASKMIEIGKGGIREIAVPLLFFYACYLVIQNADGVPQTCCTPLRCEPSRELATQPVPNSRKRLPDNPVWFAYLKPLWPITLIRILVCSCALLAYATGYAS